MPQRKQRKAKRHRDQRPLWQQAFDLDVIRKLPFWMLAFASILVAYRAPYGRKPYYFSFDMSWDAILFSAFKPLHILGCAVLMVAGVLAYKWKRWWLAALLTMAVGLS